MTVSSSIFHISMRHEFLIEEKENHKIYYIAKISMYVFLVMKLQAKTEHMSSEHRFATLTVTNRISNCYSLKTIIIPVPCVSQNIADTISGHRVRG